MDDLSFAEEDVGGCLRAKFWRTQVKSLTDATNVKDLEKDRVQFALEMVFLACLEANSFYELQPALEYVGKLDELIKECSVQDNFLYKYFAKRIEKECRAAFAGASCPISVASLLAVSSLLLGRVLASLSASYSCPSEVDKSATTLLQDMLSSVSKLYCVLSGLEGRRKYLRYSENVFAKLVYRPNRQHLSQIVPLVFSVLSDGSNSKMVGVMALLLNVSETVTAFNPLESGIFAFLKELLSFRGELDVHVIQAFRRLMPLLKIEHFEELLADSSRLLLRSPETTSKILDVLLDREYLTHEQLRLTISWFASKSRDTIIAGFKSSSPSTRDHMTNLYRTMTALAIRFGSKDGTVARDTVEFLAASFQRSRTTLSNDARYCFYLALVPKSTRGLPVDLAIDIWTVGMIWLEKEATESLAVTLLEGLTPVGHVCESHVVESQSLANIAEQADTRPSLLLAVCMFHIDRQTLTPNKFCRFFTQSVCAEEENERLATRLVKALVGAKDKAGLGANQEGVTGTAYAALTLLMHWHHEEHLYAKSSSHRHFSRMYSLPELNRDSVWFDERVYHKMDSVDCFGGGSYLVHIVTNLEKYNLSYHQMFLQKFVAFMLFTKFNANFSRALNDALASVYQSFGNNFQQLALANSAIAASAYAHTLSQPPSTLGVQRLSLKMLRFLAADLTRGGNSAWIVPSAICWIYLATSLAEGKGARSNIFEKSLKALSIQFGDLLASDREAFSFLKNFCFAEIVSRDSFYLNTGIPHRFCNSSLGRQGKVKLLLDIVSHPEAPEDVLELVFEECYSRLSKCDRLLQAISSRDIGTWKTTPPLCYETPAAAKVSTKNSASLEAKAAKAAVEKQLQKEAAVRNSVECMRVAINCDVSLLLAFLSGYKLPSAVSPQSYTTLTKSYVALWVTFYSKIICRELASDSFLMTDTQVVSALETFTKFACVISRLNPITACLAVPLALRLVGTSRSEHIYQTLLAPRFEPWSFAANPCSFYATALVKTFSVKFSPIASLLVPLFANLIDKNQKLYKSCNNVRLRQDAIQLAATQVAAIARAFTSSVPRALLFELLLRVIETLPVVSSKAQPAILELANEVGDDQTRRLDELDSFKTSAFESAEEAQIVSTLIGKSNNINGTIRATSFGALEPLECPDNLQNTLEQCFIAGYYDSDKAVQLRATQCTELFGGIEALLTRHSQQVEDYEFYLKRMISESEAVATASGKAFAELARLGSPLNWHELLDIWRSEYSLLAKPLVDIIDERGIVVTAAKDQTDPWELRLGLALGLAELLPCVSSADIRYVFENLFIDGALAFGDRDERVRSAMVNACLEFIDTHALENLEQLDQMLQDALESVSVTAYVSEVVRDNVKESVVICIGKLGAHLLEGDDKRIRKIVKLLLETLATPSESVQYAVADCLPALLQKVKAASAPALLETLLTQLSSKHYAERRGAAYGLAGLVKGRGLYSIYKELHLFNKVKEAAADKNEWERRESALMVIELQSLFLKRKFEPYVIHLVPLLLTSFSDANAQVRQATEETARVLMQGLSGHCVKKILPQVLKGLFEKAWRSQVGSIEMLGAMAYLAPRQLSQNLPLIIPELCRCLRDPHERVQKAASSALQQFGQVIQSEEIRPLVPTLMKALEDPNTKTGDALKALLEMSFYHFIDGPSLALLMPIVQRGLKERATEIKQRAAQITGNLMTLAEERDLQSYLGALVGELLRVLVDPVPETRAISAKALGLCLAKMPTTTQSALVNKLFSSLQSTGGHSVDRWGVAQGLSEVLFRLGTEHLDALFPKVISNTTAAADVVREGHLVLLSFLPVTFGLQLSPYLPQVIQPILRGLADDSEIVRTAGMKAGRMFVRNYSDHSIVQLLLPELEKGISHERWRIRQTSLQLLGYMFLILTDSDVDDSRLDSVAQDANLADEEREDGEVDAVGDSIDEDVERNKGATHVNKVSPHEKSLKVLEEKLGPEALYRVLGECYLAKCDSNGMVRLAANEVWRIGISNTFRMLKSMISVLLDLIIPRLGYEEHEDKRAVAETALQELVGKLGETVTSQILARLSFELQSSTSTCAIKCGVCFALRHIVQYVGKNTLETVFEPAMLLIKRALFDDEERVAQAAAEAFDTLQQHYPESHAVEDIVGYLLEVLQKNFTESGEQNDQFAKALGGLKALLSVRASAIITVLLPSLLSSIPLSNFSLQILCVLCSSGSPSLERRMPGLLRSLVETGCICGATPELENVIAVLVDSLDESLTAFLDYVGDLIQRQLQRSRFADQEERIKSNKELEMSCIMAAKFFADGERSAGMSTVLLAEFASYFIACFSRPDFDASLSLLALSRLVSGLDKQAYFSLVPQFKISICSLRSSSGNVSGLSLPKALTPLLAVLLHGLVYSAEAEVRLEALEAIAVLVTLTSEFALSSYVIQIAGPIIRVLGDRNPLKIKVLLLGLIGQLLRKTPKQLVPFLPQLQRTLITYLRTGDSSTEDANLELAQVASEALDQLVVIQPRLDWVLNEVYHLSLESPDNNLYVRQLVGIVEAIKSTGKPLPQGLDEGISSLTAMEQVEPQLAKRLSESLRAGRGF